MAGKILEITVEGMSCSHCAAAVRKALEQLEGVQRAEVDLPGKIVRIEHDPAAVNRESMKKAIEGQGYRVV